MPEFTLKPATSAEHRTAVFRLRYDVYVKEMGRTQRYADHSRSQVEEPMDTAGHVVAAFAGAGDVVGTVRSNLLRLTSSTGLYEDLYDFAALQPAVREYTSITTKLIVHRDFRNTSLAAQLASGPVLSAVGLQRSKTNHSSRVWRRHVAAPEAPRSSSLIHGAFSIPKRSEGL
jgi:hypothetical protein